MPQVQEYETLTIAEGTLGPANVLAKGEVTQEEIDDFCERLLTDEFYDDCDPEEIVDGCVDGRGVEEIGPNAAGGSFTYVMADALTVQGMRKDKEQAPGHARRVFTFLKKLGKKIGGHGATHAHGPNCGCGAEDSLDPNPQDGPSILNFINRRADEIREALAAKGIQIKDKTHAQIKQRAEELHEESYATSGKELSDVTKEVGGEQCVKILPGEHNEVVAVLILNARKKLSRAKINAVYGGRLMAFAVNIPAIEYGTKLMSATGEEAEARFAGAMYYNVATASVLGGPDLRILVKE